MEIPKKAQVESSYLYWMLFAVAVGFVTIGIIYMGYYFVSGGSEIPNGIEEEIIIARFYNSGNCFAYGDEVGRVHTGVIDINKFNSENMEKCFPSNVGYAFSLSLEVPELNINLGPINTFNWVSVFSPVQKTEDVFVLKNGIKYKAKLNIKTKNIEPGRILT